MYRLIRFLFMAIVSAALVGCDRSEGEITRRDVSAIQLNWIHEPTFVAEYILSEKYPDEYRLIEGGQNIFPLAEVFSQRANYAVVGADIFLKTFETDENGNLSSDYRVVFADFQRNPVGWVLHPEAAEELGLNDNQISEMTDQELNNWLFAEIKSGNLEVGDKRGTETTAIWLAWATIRNVVDQVQVTPVGFDASIVLSAPKLIFPVYLNEEPFRLAEKIGQDLVVFDPAADGISAYGNVIVTSASFSLSNPEAIKKFKVDLSAAWSAALSSEDAALDTITQYYDVVSEDTLKKQLRKTLDFAFYGTRTAGALDLTDNGRWSETLENLQKSGAIDDEIDINLLREYIIQ